MKYLIIESQLEKTIFRYLDNQDFIHIERGNALYFFYSKDDEYAKIRYDIKNDNCVVDVSLIIEISEFFSLDKFDVKDIIKEWLENKIDKKVGTIYYPIHPRPMILRIPD